MWSIRVATTEEKRFFGTLLGVCFFIEVNGMPIFQNMVTCLYCKHLSFSYSEKENISLHSQGYCDIKKGNLSLDTEICVNFAIKAGLYTGKWYPDKKDT